MSLLLLSNKTADYDGRREKVPTVSKNNFFQMSETLMSPFFCWKLHGSTKFVVRAVALLSAKRSEKESSNMIVGSNMLKFTVEASKKVLPPLMKVIRVVHSSCCRSPSRCEGAGGAQATKSQKTGKHS